jgi:hypothetical protein
MFVTYSVEKIAIRHLYAAIMHIIRRSASRVAAPR